MNVTRKVLLTAVAVAMTAAALAAPPPSPQVLAVRDRWADVNYTVPKAQREGQFDDAEACAEVAAGDRDRTDRLGPQFVGGAFLKGHCRLACCCRDQGTGASKRAKAAAPCSTSIRSRCSTVSPGAR